MAIVNKDNLLERVKNIIGDNLSDDNVSFMEDISDTLTDLESKNNTDWEQKYNDLNASWRKRYVDRFSGIKDEEFETELGIKKPEKKPDQRKPDPEINEDITIDELFKESD